MSASPSAWLIAHEAPVRAGAFVLVAALMLGLERWRPRRVAIGGWQRRAVNFTLVGLDTLVLRLGFPVLAVGFALYIEDRGWGLIQVLQLPAYAAVTAGVIGLDLAIYWQHRLLHALPLLWRLHRVHHADLGFDFSTGVRFHPAEIALSMAIKLGVIAALGAPPLAVLLFELALSLGALFTHANLSLPLPLDRRLRGLFVTPDMHRIHHSWHRDETDSNFGFHLSCWDRLFGTYRKLPRDGQAAMTIGLESFRSRRDQTLLALLLNPLRATDRTLPRPAAGR
jgi:sterol desaturase/sphingolipid hydroxylase (fatty acid hydroxylase superfamily)